MNIYASRPDATHMSKSSKTPTYSALLTIVTCILGPRQSGLRGRAVRGRAAQAKNGADEERSRRKTVQTANGRRSCTLRTEGVRWHKAKEVKAAARAGLKVECG